MKKNHKEIHQMALESPLPALTTVVRFERTFIGD
jgi:hypothetical protein